MKDPKNRTNEEMRALADWLSQTREALQSAEGDTRKRYDPNDVDSMVDYAEVELGVKLRDVPAVENIFRTAVSAFAEKRILRLAILGPRGGGKTFLAALIETMAWRWYNYDWANLGGSEQQAGECYRYIREYQHHSEDIRRYTLQSIQNYTLGRRRNWMRVLAATQKRVRGPHPGGPRKGGGLSIDEVAVVPDDIVDAARYQLTSANPSASLYLSTMGEHQTGRWWEMVQKPQDKGFMLLKFSIFDAAKRCEYDCKTTCPSKEHFAEDYHNAQGELVHRAYCAGKAHEVDGWIHVDEIAQQFRESDRGTFEREAMGWQSESVGHVYDPTTIDEASRRNITLLDPREHQERFLELEKVVGWDYGWSNETAVSFFCRVQNVLIHYRTLVYTQTRFSEIRETVAEMCDAENVNAIMCDSSNPSDTAELKHILEARRRSGTGRYTVVRSVSFGKYKDWMISELRRRLELGIIRIPEKFGDVPVVNHQKVVSTLKGYSVDPNTGRPVKKDDHIPDAWGLACLYYSPKFNTQPRLHYRRKEA